MNQRSVEICNTGKEKYLGGRNLWPCPAIFNRKYLICNRENVQCICSPYACVLHKILPYSFCTFSTSRSRNIRYSVCVAIAFDYKDRLLSLPFYPFSLTPSLLSLWLIKFIEASLPVMFPTNIIMNW